MRNERRLEKLEQAAGSDAKGEERRRIALAALADAQARVLQGIPTTYPPDTAFLSQYRPHEIAAALRGQGRTALSLAERLRDARRRNSAMSADQRRESMQRSHDAALAELRKDAN